MIKCPVWKNCIKTYHFAYGSMCVWSSSGMERILPISLCQGPRGTSINEGCNSRPGYIHSIYTLTIPLPNSYWSCIYICSRARSLALGQGWLGQRRRSKLSRFHSLWESWRLYSLASVTDLRAKRHPFIKWKLLPDFLWRKPLDPWQTPQLGTQLNWCCQDANRPIPQGFIFKS